MPPFVVFSLPRSRSTWLSVFLSRPDALCGHDIGPTLSSPDEFAKRLTKGLAGTCETGAAFAWRLIRRRFPDAPFVVVLRDPGEVVISLARFGVTGIASEIEARWNDLAEISAQPNVFTVDFNDLRHEGFCAEIYRHCLRKMPPRGWWQALAPLNIQVDVPATLAAVAARAGPIAELKARARAMLAHG